MRLWLLRVVWLVLPVATVAALDDAVAGWSDAPTVVATVLLWVTWGIGLVALLAPRPAGLTALRVIAPTFVVIAVVVAVAGVASTTAAAAAVLATVVAAGFVADPALALTSANGVAYGDERRYPLRTPPGLYLLPVPLARVLVAAGIATGPLLLADGAYLAGAATALVGWPLAWFAARALHTLACRWLVLVPAGIVLVDPMTLADPVLFVRRSVRSVRAVDGTARVPAGALDLRLGASWGSLLFLVDGETGLVRLGRRHRTAEVLHPDTIVVAVAARDALLPDAAGRRVPVELA